MRDADAIRLIRDTLATVLSLTMLAAAGRAEAPDTTGWTCTRCPQASGWDLNIEAGPAWVSDDAYRFGDYTGLDDSGAYLFGDVFARYLDDRARYLVVEGFARGPDSNALFARGGKQGSYELRASIRSIPRRFFASTVTAYAGNGTGQLTLPAAWVRAPTTGQMTALPATARALPLGSDRDIYGLGLDLEPTRRWGLSVDYTRHERDGLARSSGSFLFDAVEFAAPVDDTTDNLEVALQYAAESWQARLAYFGSVYHNDVERLAWDNPYTSPVGADTGQLARPPDNQSHQVSLSGSMRLPARSTLNAQVAVGRLSQDADLLPYTTNGLLPANPLPVTSADAEADTLTLNARAVTSPWRRVTLQAELRYHDFDNRTTVNRYAPIVTDVVPAAAPADSTAYDYERREIGLRGEYRLPAGLKLSAGFDTERFERNDQDRSRTTTNRAWFGGSTRLGAIADLDAELFVEDRDGSEYRVVDDPVSPENPLLRKYNLADRERDGIRLRGSVFAGERTDFGWEFEYSRDRYDHSEIGLTDTDYVMLGADLTFLVGSRASAWLGAYHETFATDQQNSQSFAAPDWAATTEDRYSSATLGLEYPGLVGRLDATFEYTWAYSVGETKNNTSGLRTSFPDLRSKRRGMRLGLTYPYTDALSFGFDVYFESLDTDDWSLDGVEPATVPNLLSLGADPWNYDVATAYLSVIYRL